MTQIELRQICHSRAGDKGNHVNLSLICFDETHYDLVRDKVTVELVAEHFKDMLQGPVERFELPKVGALNFLLRDVLGGGSTRGLRRDLHGKALSGPFLDITIDVPQEVAELEFRV